MAGQQSHERADDRALLERVVSGMLDPLGVYEAVRSERGDILDFRVVYVNEAACRANRLSREAQVGRLLCDILPGHRDSELFRQYCEVVRSGEPLRLNHVVYTDRYEGVTKTRVFDISISRLDDGIVAVWRDVSAAVEAHESRALSLAQQAGHLRALVNALPTFVAYVTPELRFVAVNDTYSARFGLTPEQCVGRHARDVVGDGPYERLLPYMQRALEGESVQVELDVAYETGRRFVSFQFVPHVDEDGRVLGMIGSGLDLTERRKLEQSLQDADQQKDQMLGVISHEIRNCLSPIQSGIGLWAAQVPADVQLRAREIMQRQLNQLTRLTGDLLDLTRIRQSTLALHAEVLDLHAAIGDAVDTVMPLIAARRHQLDVRLGDGALLVTGDRQRLAQVFTNLLSNAKRYTQEGGRITVSTAPRDGRAIVTVTDNGPGFAADLLPRLFNPFVRGVGYRDVPAGLGLGLHIVREIVRLHGGEVHAANGDGGGAVMTVTLPLVVR